MGEITKFKLKRVEIINDTPKAIFEINNLTSKDTLILDIDDIYSIEEESKISGYLCPDILNARNAILEYNFNLQKAYS